MTGSVLALDIGAGNTKFMASKDGKIVKAGFFPSVVSLATGGALASFQSSRGLPSEVTPVVDGVAYKVSLAKTSNLTGATRVSPGDDFQNSAHHTALLATGLHAAGLEHLDILAVGAPVHTFDKHRDRLAEIRGPVDFGLGKHYVGSTVALPQPFGSLLAGLNEGLLPGTSAAQLVIDVGYYSVDVLRARDLIMQTAHSFSLDTGMGKIYRMIADALAQQIRKPVNNLDQIEFCLRTRTPYFAYGKQFFLDEFAREIQAHVDAYVLELYGRVGTAEDIASVCVTGGGGEFFLSAIGRRFGDIPVCVMREPLMANVRGFLVAGQSAIANQVA